MSSRVLPVGAANEPIAWRVLAPGAPRRDGAPNGDAPPDSAAEAKNSEAADRVAALEREVEQREQQAFAAGLRKGEAAGRENAAAVLAPVAEKLARTAEELSSARRKLRREAEDDVVKLALAIARRILRRELNMDPEALLGVVKAALDKIDGREVDRLRVHPDDAPVVRRYLDQTPGRHGVEVVEDARLERGAAIFETPRGALDASLETQLQEIQRGLADRIRACHDHA